MQKAEEWSPRAWLRYWSFGWLFAPIILIWGVIDGDGQIIGIGVVALFLTFGMTGFWRRKIQEAPPTDG